MADKYHGHPSDNYDYIIEATNELYTLSKKKITPTSDSLVEITSTGCNTLNRLSRDLERGTGFYSDLVGLSNYKNENLTEFRDIVSNVSRFTEFFLTTEKEALIKAGMRFGLANELIKLAERLRLSILIFPADPDEIKEDILEFRDFLCNLAKEMERYSNLERRLRRLVYAMGGIATIAVNSGTLVLPPAVPAISLAMGGVLLKEIFKKE